MKKIDELESEASRNDISPGALRSDVEPEKSNEASDNSVPSGGPETTEAEKLLRETKDDLKRLWKELDLLQRRLPLEEREVYSNPNYLSSRTGDSRLASRQGEIAAKDRAIQETEQNVGQLEEHLEDLKQNWPTEVRSDKNSGAETNGPDSGVCRQTDAAIACTVNEKAQQEKDEGYWRKRFSEVRYEINIAENERDILEGELGVLLLQYEANPAKAMRENVTRKQITEHQKAIEDKKREIAQLRLALADLEDELRRAGGPPGWSRE
jgi:chromosome segregation ATPase